MVQMGSGHVKTVVFQCPGNCWCYAVPKEHKIEGIAAELYQDLKEGEIVVTCVGHFDYNTAKFDVELKVTSVREEDNTIYYGLEFYREIPRDKK